MTLCKQYAHKQKLYFLLNTIKVQKMVGTLCSQFLVQLYTDLFLNIAGAFVMVWRYSCGLNIMVRLA